MHDQAARLDRLSTGSPALDLILGGGLPTHSVTVISGEPGSGKTVTVLQILFHLVREGKKCLYFSTLSEPSIKLMRHMQLFSFFDADVVGKRLILADIGGALRQGNAEATLSELTERVE